MTYYFIYKTTNTVTNEYYIGKHETKNLNDNYLGSGLRLRNAIEKYGKEKFVREIIEFCESKNELNEREIYHINLHISEEKCYNIALGGQGGCISLFPENPKYEEIKNKISRTKHKTSDLIYERTTRLHEEKRIGMYGKRHSEETKQKMRISQKGKSIGRKLSIETKAKISKAQKGKSKPSFSEQHKRNISLNHHDVSGSNNPMYDKRHSEETINLLSEKAKNRKKYECPHCSMLVTAGNFKRWHGDNCKMRINV